MPAETSALIRGYAILSNDTGHKSRYLEGNRSGNLQCVALEGRSALKFVKIFSAYTHLAFGQDCVDPCTQSVDLVPSRGLFRRYRRARFVRGLSLNVAH